MKKLITENGIKITAKKKFTVNFFQSLFRKQNNCFFVKSNKKTKLQKNGENKMKLKTTIAINGMAFRVYEDNGLAICHTSASVPQKIADKVKSLSGRYNSIYEVTKSVINLIKEL